MVQSICREEPKKVWIHILIQKSWEVMNHLFSRSNHWKKNSNLWKYDLQKIAHKNWYRQTISRVNSPYICVCVWGRRALPVSWNYLFICTICWLKNALAHAAQINSVSLLAGDEKPIHVETRHTTWTQERIRQILNLSGWKFLNKSDRPSESTDGRTDK